MERFEVVGLSGWEKVPLHANTATRHINFEQGTSRRRGGCTEKRQIKVGGDLGG